MLVPVFVSLPDSDLSSYVQWSWKFLQQQMSQKIIGHLTQSWILVPYHSWWGCSPVFYPVADELIFFSLDHPCKFSNSSTYTKFCHLFKTLQAYQPPNSSPKSRSCGEWRVMASGKALFLFIIPRAKHTWIPRDIVTNYFQQISRCSSQLMTVMELVLECVVLMYNLTLTLVFVQPFHLNEKTYNKLDFWAKVGCLKFPWAMFAYPFYLVCLPCCSLPSFFTIDRIC